MVSLAFADVPRYHDVINSLVTNEVRISENRAEFNAVRAQSQSVLGTWTSDREAAIKTATD
eukprot:6224614-Pyramimonas_sp.AAC.1